MLTIPAMYQEGINKGSQFTGVILKINGVPLWGNVATHFDEGTVYDIINSWSGVDEWIDVMENKYKDTIITFTIDNSEYRPNGTATPSRPTDDLAGKSGAIADIYYVNNRRASELAHCLHRASGSIQSIEAYDTETVKVKVLYKGATIDTKILNNTLRSLDGETPAGNELQFAPKVYSTWEEGLHGLAKVYRVNEDEPARFAVCDHPLKELNSLYLSTGGGLRPGENEECVKIRFNTAPNFYQYEALVFSAATGSDDPWTTVRYDLNYNLAQDLRDYGFFEILGFRIHDDRPLTQARVQATRGTDANRWGGTAWEIINQREFKKQFENSTPEAQAYVTYQNFWGAVAPIGLINRRGFKLKYHENVARSVSFRDSGFQRNTTSEPNKWISTLMLTASDVRAKLGENETINRPYALSYETTCPQSALAADDVSTLIGEAELVLRYYQDPTLEEEGTKGLLTGWASCQGRMYDSWIDSFGGGNGFTYEGRLIETGAGILASLLIDEGPLSATSIDFHSGSFSRNFFSGIPMRLNIIKDSVSFNKIATELGKQAPWTFCFTAHGQARLVTTRRVLSGDPLDATIDYHELKDGLKIGLTNDKYVVNELTVLSRYFPELGRFMDEEVFTNSESQAQYGVRKKTVKWENIDSGFHTEGGGPSGAPQGNGDTVGTTPVPAQPYKRITSGAVTRGVSTWSSAKPINNPVWYMAEHLVRQDESATGNGLWSKQHNEVQGAILPGTKYTALEIGDAIKFNNDGFAARNITVFGEPFTNKIFLITHIHSNEKVATIKKAMETMEDRLLPLSEEYPNPFD